MDITSKAVVKTVASHHEVPGAIWPGPFCGEFTFPSFKGF